MSLEHSPARAGHNGGPSLEPLAFPIEYAAKLLNLSKSALYNRIASGELRSYKVGPKRMISRAALVDFIEAREREGAVP